MPTAVRTLEAPTGQFLAAGAKYLADDQTPRRRYRKDVIAIGEYSHPQAGWSLDVTPERLAGWLEKLHRMLSAGVPIPVKEDHVDGAAAVRGYIRDGWIEDDRLVLVHEMKDQKGIDLAEVVESVSVEINPEFTDGKGVEWGEAITASAIVPHPVAHGQRPFERMAASLVAPSQPEPEPTKMADSDLKTMLLSVAEATGKDTKGVKDAPGAVALLLSTITEIKAERDDAAAAVENLTAELTTAKAVSPDPQLSDEVAALSRRSLSMELDELVRGGRITPAVRNDLQPLMATTKMLSVAPGQQEPGYAGILAALSKNDPVELGMKTTAQGREVPRETPGGGNTATADELAEERRKLLANGVSGGFQF